MVRINIKGQIYGRLTVIELIGYNKHHKSIWLCKCACGKDVTTSSNLLRRGHIKSCGCYWKQLFSKTKTINIIGKRYGRLTVLQREGTNRDGKAMWKCRCDCGKEVVVIGKNLRTGNSKSCGCKRLKISEKYKDGKKMCNLCKQYKITEEFNKNHISADGLAATCRSCKSIYRSNHRDQSAIRKNRRRVRKLHAKGSHTAREWEQLKTQYGDRCLRCGKTNVPLTRDHVIPLVKGGPDSIDNIQPLCRSCNGQKYDKTIDYRKEYCHDAPCDQLRQS